MAKSNIVLFGFMGTGKSSAGKLVAGILEKTFVDMDERIEQREKRPISAIFAEDGEPYFRGVERSIVSELAGKENLVIATGGGVVLNKRNIEDFGRRGVLVCLQASIDVIFERVAGENHRPLLEQDNKKEAARLLLEKRRNLYNSIPNQVETSHVSLERVAQRIIDIYRKTLSF